MSSSSSSGFVVGWTRKLLRVHDNPLLCLLANTPSSSLGVYHFDCLELEDVLIHHNPLKNRFLNALIEHGGARLEEAVGVIKSLQKNRRHFQRECVREFKSSLGCVALHTRTLQDVGDEASGLLRELVKNLCYSETRLRLAELRGEVSARIMCKEVCKEIGRSTDVTVVFDRLQDPEGLAEELKFREVFQQDLADISPNSEVKFVPISAHYLLVGDFTQYVENFSFSTKPLSYNPFVATIEKCGISPSIPQIEMEKVLNVFKSPVKVDSLSALDLTVAGKTVSLGVSSEIARETDTKTPSTSWFPSGERAGLSKLNGLCDDYIVNFSKPDTNPMHLGSTATTGISPYLANGSLAVRVAYERFRTAELRAEELLLKEEGSLAQRSMGHTSPPQSLVGQLFWREFSHWLHLLVGANFCEMVGNAVCLQRRDWTSSEKNNPNTDTDWLISLFFRSLVSASAGSTGSSKKTIDESYTLPPTTIPALNAGLVQLHSTGWCHHIMRHFLACYISRILSLPWGWEIGRDYFEAVLIDHDNSINISQWQWLSCSFLFYNFNRVYHCDGFQKKWDKSFSYNREWLPLAWWKVPVNEPRKGLDYSLLTDDYQSITGSKKSLTEKLCTSIYEECRDTGIEELKKAFNDQERDFYRNLQPNVVEEWKKEDREFGSNLELNISHAWAHKKQDLNSYFERNFPGFRSRPGIELIKAHPVKSYGFNPQCDNSVSVRSSMVVENGSPSGKSQKKRRWKKGDS